MDAEFIQSVARVGSQVRIALISGDSCEGMLEELTLTRLTVRQADGVPVAVALAAVAMVRPLAAAAERTEQRPAAPPQLSAPAPAPHAAAPAHTPAPAPQTAAPPPAAAPPEPEPGSGPGSGPEPLAAPAPAPASVPPPPPVPAPAAVTATPAPGAPPGSAPVPAPPPAAPATPAAATSVPVPATTSVPVPATTPVPDPGAGPPPAPGSADPAARAAALEVVAALSVLPVDQDVQVSPENRGELLRIKDSFQYAVKTHELAPVHGRVAKCYSRTIHLWNAERPNAGLARLIGAFAILKGDVESAHRYLTVAAQGGDTAAWRLLAVTAARGKDPDPATAVYALLRFFRHTAPAADDAAWQALLGLLDATAGTRSQLGELRGAPAHDPAARAAVGAALGSAVPATTPTPRPAGVLPALAGRQPPPRPRTPAPHRNSRPEPAAARPGRGAAEDHYQRAKNLEHTKDFDGAKAAYRRAIKSGGAKRESAVKDLAWLTRRIDGPEAALRVIEVEYRGMIRPGDSLDNIMIDFLTGARRFPEALERLGRQSRRADLTGSKRYHLLHQIANTELRAGQEATAAWQAVLDLNPEDQTAQRGMAVALVQRARPGDLDRAEQLVSDHVAAQSETIRRRIAALRQGDADNDQDASDWLERMLESSEVLDSTAPLVTYVVQHYSELARSTKELRERRRDRVRPGDLNTMAESARQWRATGQEENSVQAYISASVLARELGEPSAQRYLCLGLTILADIVRDRQQYESARDLYCAALAAADERDDDDRVRDVRTALIGYLRSPNGRMTGARRRREREESTPLVVQIANVLEEEYVRNGTALFDLFPPLLADTGQSRELVLEALALRPALLAAAARHLGVSGPAGAEPDGTAAGGASPAATEPDGPDQTRLAAWQSVGDRWIRYRRQLEHARDELRQVTIEDSALEPAISRLRDVIEISPQSLHDPLDRLLGGLYELQRFGREVSFEERENCLRLARGAAAEVRADIERGPTGLAVGLIEPVALHIQGLVDEARGYLLGSQPPRPGLSLALEQSSGGHNGVVTVQIKVSNAPGMAPIESPELVISDDDPGLYSVDGEPAIQIPTVVRGGEHRIQAVKLRITAQGFTEGSFSLPVALRYRPRSSENSEHTEEFQTRLPVRLAREEEFERIPNAFSDGATGRPVQDPNMFYGRDELIDRIRSRLRDAATPGVGVAIFGQKRAGKSSIRHHLCKRLVELDGLPVVDVGNIGSLSPEKDDAHGTRLRALLMWRILQGADKALRELDPQDAHGAGPLIPDGLSKEKFLAGPEPVHDCAELVQGHRDRYRGRPPTLTVLIDEFQYIDLWIRQGMLSSSFMQSFKALVERQIFHLVIVGQDALDRMVQEDPNVFGVFTTERVTYLVDAEARKLIERPIVISDGDREISRYRERAADRVIELTGGSPFYIQRFCWQLVEYMNSERVPFVTEADVEQVRADFLEQLEVKDFDNLESPGYTDPQAATSKEYQAVLLAVARASRNQPATLQAINAEYEGSRLPELLKDLEVRDVVRHESGRYRIVVRLYQEWLLRYFGATSSAGGWPNAG